MRRLVSIPVAVLMSLIIAGTALASFCGNESKRDGAGQHATLWVDLSTAPPTQTIIEGANAAGKVTGGFVDVHLDFNGDGVSDCFINDTYFISEHSGHIAPGQDLDGLAVVPAVHKGRNPGGDSAGVGFAELSAGCG